MRTMTKVVAGAMVLLALAGCGGGKPTFSAMAEGPATGEELPAYVDLGPEMEPVKVRLLAEQDGYAFYAAQPDQPGFCLTIVNRQVEEEWVTGCATPIPPHFSPVDQSLLKVGGPAGVVAKLALDGYDASEDLAAGWEQLHPNLLVVGL